MIYRDSKSLYNWVQAPTEFGQLLVEYRKPRRESIQCQVAPLCTLRRAWKTCCSGKATGARARWTSRGSWATWWRRAPKSPTRLPRFGTGVFIRCFCRRPLSPVWPEITVGHHCHRRRCSRRDHHLRYRHCHHDRHNHRTRRHPHRHRRRRHRHCHRAVTFTTSVLIITIIVLSCSPSLSDNRQSSHSPPVQFSDFIN